MTIMQVFPIVLRHSHRILRRTRPPMVANTRQLHALGLLPVSIPPTNILYRKAALRHFHRPNLPIQRIIRHRDMRENTVPNRTHCGQVIILRTFRPICHVAIGAVRHFRRASTNIYPLYSIVTN